MFDVPEYNGIGIYALIDNNGKMYVGSSKNIRHRLKEHSKGLLIGKDSKNLIDAVKDGLTFKCEILEQIPYGCNTYYLRSRENYYIEKHDTVNNGYNAFYVPAADEKEGQEKATKNKWQRKIHNNLSKPIQKSTKAL
jgi:group I intron endonuclease